MGARHLPSGLLEGQRIAGIARLLQAIGALAIERQQPVVVAMAHDDGTTGTKDGHMEQLLGRRDGHGLGGATAQTQRHLTHAAPRGLAYHHVIAGRKGIDNLLNEGVVMDGGIETKVASVVIAVELIASAARRGEQQGQQRTDDFSVSKCPEHGFVFSK